MKVVLSPSFAMESQALTKHTAMNALKELWKTCMLNKLTRNTPGTLSLLYLSKKEKLKSKRKWSGTRIQRRDATSMWRTSPQAPLMSNWKKSFPSLERLRVLEFSLRKEKLSMPLFASRTQNLLRKLKLTYTSNHLMEKLSTLTIMKSRK
jgi:hypothetical protein